MNSQDYIDRAATAGKAVMALDDAIVDLCDAEAELEQTGCTLEDSNTYKYYDLEALNVARDILCRIVGSCTLSSTSLFRSGL